VTVKGKRSVRVMQILHCRSDKAVKRAMSHLCNVLSSAVISATDCKICWWEEKKGVESCLERLGILSESKRHRLGKVQLPSFSHVAQNPVRALSTAEVSFMHEHEL